MLFGAALVSIGIIAGALADRIRDPRAKAYREARKLEARLAAPGRRVYVRPPEPELHPFKRTSLDSVISERAMLSDVVSALVTMGWTKKIATEAAIACKPVERATIENWIRAALKQRRHEVITS
jgi:hypothetical protein